MSDEEASNSSSGKDSLYKEPEYDSDGFYVEKGEQPESSSSEEEEENDSSTEEEEEPEPNSYMALRAQRIARNCARLIELGLTTQSGKTRSIASQLKSPKKRSATGAATSPCTSVTTNDPSTPRTRKSPRLQQLLEDRTVDLANENVQTTTTTTPVIENMTINMDVDPQSSQRQMARRRLWNSDIARSANEIGKARNRRDVAEFGEMCIIHPVKLAEVKVKNGMVKESSKQLFYQACEAYVRHHAEYNCRNYQKRSYVTKCTCTRDLIEGTNSVDKIKQVCNCLWEYFTRIKDTQKLVMKEWIRNVMFSDVEYKTRCLNVSYVLPGVYLDACTETTQPSRNLNIVPYKVCLNAISVLFDYGYGKIKTIKESMCLAGVKQHGLKNKVSNRLINNKDHYQQIEESLHKYFKVLQEGAETHATRVIREATGVALRDEEVDLVELPSSHTKRQLFHSYCYE